MLNTRLRRLKGLTVAYISIGINKLIVVSSATIGESFARSWIKDTEIEFKIEELVLYLRSCCYLDQSLYVHLPFDVISVL